MRLRIKKTDPAARLPKYVHGADDAALDLHSIELGILKPGHGRGFRTGLAFELPKGYVGLVWDRSGLAFNNGLTTLAGLLDPGFRGEVWIYLFNTGQKAYRVQKGERIAQLVVVAAPRVTIQQVKSLTKTVRGARGLGSSGKQ